MNSANSPRLGSVHRTGNFPFFVSLGEYNHVFLCVLPLCEVLIVDGLYETSDFAVYIWLCQWTDMVTLDNMERSKHHTSI